MPYGMGNNPPSMMGHGGKGPSPIGGGIGPMGLGPQVPTPQVPQPPMNPPAPPPTTPQPPMNPPAGPPWGGPWHHQPPPVTPPATPPAGSDHPPWQSWGQHPWWNGQSGQPTTPPTQPPGQPGQFGQHQWPGFLRGLFGMGQGTNT